MTPRPASPFLLATLLAAVVAPAQWNNNPAANTPIAAIPNEQTLAKLAVTPDGGVYVGWFDSRSGSYAVYVQRLDPGGDEVWQPGGVLVSGNPQSTSLVDWDLIADSAGGCVLTFTDTRAGSDLDVYAYRLAPDGTLLWGPNGVTLSNNGDYEPNPRVVEASDGDFVFAWANTGTATVHLQRLDPNGVPRYPGDGLAIPGDPGATPGFVAIAAGTGGDVILAWVRTIAFTGNKHIHAQKYDALGNPLWNGGVRVAVFDQASVPFAHQPRLIPDGAGGALCGWHFAAGSLFSARVQWLQANGAEAWSHNGVDVSTSANSKFDPALVWEPVSQQLRVAWNERNVAQTTWGIFAQGIGAGGQRLWGTAGVTLLPIDTMVKLAPVAAPLGQGMAVAVLHEPLVPLLKEVRVFGLDGLGAIQWSTAASTVPSEKLRLALATTPSGSSLLAWTDLRGAGYDIFGQAVGLDGAVGLTLAQALSYGCFVNPIGSLVATGRPAYGTTTNLALSNPLGTQSAGSLGFLFFGVQPAPGFPCGTSVPGFGMAGPGQPGEVLVDLGAGSVGVFAGVWPGAPAVLGYDFAMPFVASLLGQSLYVQGLMLDLAPAAPVVFGLSEGIWLRAGS